MLLLIAITLMTVLLAGVVSVAVVQVQAAPYYRSGDHVIVVQIRFQNDCWEEVYARATPKGSNHVLLNYQYFYNNDAPDNGPSELIREKWFFQGKKVELNSNPDKMRVYAEIEFPDGSYGPTQTFYQPYSAGQKYYYFYFNLKTNPELCD